MRRSSLLLSPLLFVSIAHAQNTPEAIRLCIPTLQNASRHIVDTTWQQNQLIRAFERINKSKDVTKRKIARTEPLALVSNDEYDPEIRDKNCEYVLRTTVVEVQEAGRAQNGEPPPGAIEVGARVGDPRAIPPEYHTATIEYQLMRVGEFVVWASGLVTAQEQLPEQTVIMRLMDQLAYRVAREFRKTP
jgi:hypothetical protein